MRKLAFEDFHPGETREYGAYSMTREEIVAFAAAYDPQPFHLDEEAGRNSIFGGLAASGWHTCAVLMRMSVEHWINQTDHVAGVGVEELRWLRPVRPGDILSAQARTLHVKPLRSRPDAGLVSFALTALDAKKQPAMTQTLVAMFNRRTPAESVVAPVRTGEAHAAAAPTGEAGRSDVVFPATYEDATVGACAELGKTSFDADFIKGFAEKFDPQPFHIDEAAANASHFGALAASGWQTAACWMRHCVDVRREAAAKAGKALESRASPGFSQMRWNCPVLAGDEIAYASQTVAKRPTSKPGYGLVTNKNTGRNQRGELVIEFLASAYVRMSGKSA